MRVVVLSWLLGTDVIKVPGMQIFIEIDIHVDDAVKVIIEKWKLHLINVTYYLIRFIVQNGLDSFINIVQSIIAFDFVLEESIF